MNKIKKQTIEEKIKIFESIRILNDTDPELIKEEINQKIEIKLNKKIVNSLTKKINILKAVQLLLTKNYFIREIADELNLSTSCIQRYLNDPIIEMELGENIKLEIQQKLSDNLDKGRKKGSENYVMNNEAAKGENGKFIGSYPKII